MKTMKKYVRILLVAMMSLMVVALAGCGEEDKYNQAKQEVTALAQQARNAGDYQNWENTPYFAKTNTPAEEREQQRKYHDKRVEMYDKALKERKEIDDKIDKKLSEMENYAKGNANLQQDFKKTKEEILGNRRAWHQIVDFWADQEKKWHDTKWHG